MFGFDLATLAGLGPMKSPIFVSDVGGIIKGVRDEIFFHKVKLYIEADWKIDVTAGFVRKLNATGILGRFGFFDHFKITFDHSSHPPVFDLEKLERPN
jgi:hypothetical protein